jgi:hypothetical protein
VVSPAMPVIVCCSHVQVTRLVAFILLTLVQYVMRMQCDSCAAAVHAYS